MRKIFAIVFMLISLSLSASHVHLSLTGVTSGTPFYYCGTTVDSVIAYKPAGAGLGDWYHPGLGLVTADSIIIVASNQGYWFFDDGTMVEFYVNFTSISPTESWTMNDTVKCTESSIVLKGQVTHQPDFTYIWNTGAVSQQINVVSSGMYYVTVTGVCGSINDQIQVINYAPPTPHLGVDVVTCDGNTITLDPGTFAGYAWSTTATTPTIDVTTDGNYSVIVTDAHGCHASDTIGVHFIVNTGQQIKLVTIDTISGNNMPTWDVLVGTANVSAKIYRNGVLVGTAPYDDGQWIDGVNSIAHMWSYQISTVDTCGNESPLSLTHSTISTATVPLVGGGFRVEWTSYLINGAKAESVDGYEILSVDGFGTNWSPTFIDSVEFDVNSYNMTNVTDSMFVVGAKLNDGSKSNVTTLALSNVVQNPLFSGIQSIVSATPISIYPNPSTGEFTVSGEGILLICDELGRCILTEEIHNESTIQLPTGTYVVSLIMDKAITTQKIIIIQ